MVPKLAIQASKDLSVDPGEIRERERGRSSIVLVLLLGFVSKKKRKKKRSESFHRQPRKALWLHRGNCGEEFC